MDKSKISQSKAEEQRITNYAHNILQEAYLSIETNPNDTERIKALLLHKLQCSCHALDYKKRIEKEWDHIEETLHYEAFWTFINPDPEHKLYASDRMNYLFELLLRCERDENGDFVDVRKRIDQNPHYIFERCMPLMLDLETDRIPFLQCDLTLKDWIRIEIIPPIGIYEISPGMLTLWLAVKILHRRMWDYFVTKVLNQPGKCLVNAKGEKGVQCMRDILWHTSPLQRG